MSGVSQGDSVSTVDGDGLVWDSVSTNFPGVSWETGTTSSFNPADLFFYGEEGAWYDPSDLTTMFQDRAGTTPVTADGQTVGLILDKSKGPVGPELIPNPIAGWTAVGTANVSVVGDEIVATGDGSSSNAGFYWALTTVVGKKYFVRGSLRSPTTNTISYCACTSASYASRFAEVGSFSSVSTKVGLFFTAVGTTTYIACFGTTGGVGDVYAAKLTSVVLAEGNHAVAPSDAARPLKTSTGLSDWINYDAVDDVLNSTFPSSLGSSCTVCRANVGAAPTILTAQTIGTSYADSTDHAGLIIINRALTGQETTDVTAWLLAKGETA
jgi:hypothetical protein